MSPKQKMEMNSRAQEDTGSGSMDLYIELHSFQHTLAEERMMMKSNCESFKEITSKIKAILGYGTPSNEIF